MRDVKKKILIFAGTTEGRRLAEVLDRSGLGCTVCVATEYGLQTMPRRDNITVLQGRLDRRQMCELMLRADGQQAFCAVVDATHPFALEVSANVKQSAQECGLPYLRLQRDTGDLQRGEVPLGYDSPGQSVPGQPKLHFCADSKACAAGLQDTEGNILLTTGSKELGPYCGRESLHERLYVRVLPGRESLELCERAGICGSRILALQGPFSRELNLAMFRQYRIRHLVTKESGSAGGFEEKLQAAAEAGIHVWVIGNPERAGGLSFAEVCTKLEDLTETVIDMKSEMEISLTGVGMGSREGLTLQAAEIIETADIVFGAARLLESLGIGGRAYPYYLAEDILPRLEELYQANAADRVRVAVLFSGDSGFYSGCEKLAGRLREWAETRKGVQIRLYPGISSVSCLAAATGHSWQDAGIVSAHGRDRAAWSGELLRAVGQHSKTFVLTSGVADVQAVGALLSGEKGKFEVITGYRLSCPEEEIARRTPEECGKLSREGLYTCLILRKANPEACRVTHGLPDSCFVRGEVPMTKEEVREVAVCKLRLTEGAVVYDIGSGTGSVAVEIAGCSPDISVYAIEHKDRAVELIQRNKEQFGLRNLTVVRAHAPEGLEGLPVPTHAFIGGSDGRLKEILAWLRRQNPGVRAVVTAVSLETVAELESVLNGPGIAEAETVCLQVSRAGKLGRYHMMQAENPVYIVSFYLTGEEETCGHREL